jgi:hypothetical protein
MDAAPVLAEAGVMCCCSKRAIGSGREHSVKQDDGDAIGLGWIQQMSIR